MLHLNHILGHHWLVVLIWEDTFCKQHLFCLLVTSHHYGWISLLIVYLLYSQHVSILYVIIQLMQVCSSECTQYTLTHSFSFLCINIQLVKYLTLYHNWVPSQQEQIERLVTTEPMYCGNMCMYNFSMWGGGGEKKRKNLRAKVAINLALGIRTACQNLYWTENLVLVTQVSDK